MRFNLLIMLPAVLLAACETPQPVSNRSAYSNTRPRHVTYYPRHFNVEVTSDPPGAMIEVDDDARGRAPCIIVIDGQADRTLPSGPGHYETTKVNAIPTEEGGAVQSKSLWPGQKIPERIFFNMRLMRPIPEIDVNVN